MTDQPDHPPIPLDEPETYNLSPVEQPVDDDTPLLVDVVAIRAGTGMDMNGTVIGCVLLRFANSALPDHEFPIMYVGNAEQLRAAGDALRGAFRHVANRVDPDARRRR